MILVGCILLTAPALADEGSECRELLRQGIYNTYRTQHSEGTMDSAHNEICTNYKSFQGHTLHANAEGRYGLYSGGASYSTEEVIAIGSAMCTANYSNKEAEDNSNNYSQVVSGELAQNFNECVKLSRIGLYTEFSFPEEKPNTVTVAIRYNPIGRPGSNKFNRLVISVDRDVPKEYRPYCEGELAERLRKEAAMEPGESLSMSCTRPVVADPTNAFKSNAKKLLAASALISIGTSVDHFRFGFPEIPLAPDFLTRFQAFYGAVRLNFTLNGEHDPCPAKKYWRNATYLLDRVQNTITGYYPTKPEGSECILDGAFSGKGNARLDIPARTIDLEGAKLTFDKKGQLLDGGKPVGYISLDP